MKVPLHYQTAAHHAEQTIRDLQITALPVDPFAIAAKKDIAVQANPKPTPGFSGCLVKIGDTFGIMHASHINSEGFIRFTVAHELGHYFLPDHPRKLFPDGKGCHHSRSGFVSRDQVEEEADHFAANLLMPARLFRDAMEDAGQGFPAIETLAALCKTSITATAIRYATHSADPVAVVVSHGSRIEYCFLSEPLRDLRATWLRKGDYPPTDSQTYAFNRTTGKVENAEKAYGYTSLALWMDGAPDIEMKEDVVGLGSYDRTLTVLFTEQALDDEDDEDSEDYDD